jgi:probable rRNA maturation factor
MPTPADFPDPTHSTREQLPEADPSGGSPNDSLGIKERVDVTVEHATRSVDREQVATLVQRVVRGEGKTLRHVSVVCGDHQLVRQLNREYLDHDYNTDVLSFSLADAPQVVDGEVYIDLDTAAERHGEFGESFEQEASRYVAHGVLHLCGYDDATPDEKQHMHNLEDRYLPGDPSSQRGSSETKRNRRGSKH